MDKQLDPLVVELLAELRGVRAARDELRMEIARLTGYYRRDGAVPVAELARLVERPVGS